MQPFSKEEIQAIKDVPVKEYLEIPILYQKELTYLLSTLLPKLIEVAEDHKKIHGVLEGLNRPPRITTEELLQMETDLISNLESDVLYLKNFYSQKVQDWVEVVTPPAPPVPEVPKLGFWRRLYNRLLCR